MVILFHHVLREALTLGGVQKKVVVAFAWPRGATGWTHPAVEAMVKDLPFTCSFYGCQYGLMSTAGRFKKPWRIQVSSDVLTKPLGQRCTGGHTH
eukprot:12400730-Heterocapsa_arctica.AAC.1